MNAPAFCLERVTVSRGGRAALDEVSLAAEPGEFVGVIGPNGAGKTTLLTVINGLCRPAAGRVETLGVSLDRKREACAAAHGTFLRRRIGYVAQHAQSDPRAPVSCREAVMLGRVGRIGLLRRPGAEDRAIVERAMATVGVAALADRPVGLVSGGEARKVSIARALAQEPELLLLDEPLAGLDRCAAPGVLALVDGLHRQRALTTVMVTHQPEDLPDCCRRVVILRAGRVFFDGDRAAALAPERLDEGYRDD